ncbi:MAG: antibiotic biosynthesis monooxygenase [Gammaproteobacteria bacterium]|nr:antibiotic biosynthesis monooxygenase [Gammaproteobacteria bacterium]
MPRITLKGHMLVPDADLAAVLAELPNHIELTRREPGCLTFTVNQNPENANRFDVFEEFCDQHAFEHHQERVPGSRWGTITANAVRHYTVEGLA